MTEPNISTKGWTSDQKIDLLLTMLSVNNPKLTGGSWDVIAAKLNKKHPEKTREAARQAFQKLRNPYLAQFGEGEVTSVINKGVAKSKTTSRNKRTAPAGEADDDNDDENDQNGTPAVTATNRRKPRAKMVKKGARDKDEPIVRGINGHGDEGLEVDET